VQEAAKKARERVYLERFRENFAGFPEGEVVPSERPDFLIKTQSRWIGLELTEYHVQEPDEGKGSPMRALEGTEDKVLRLASEKYQSKGLAPVVVSVLWHPHHALDRRRILELATDLANLVQEHLPETGHGVTIRRPHPAWRSLPHEVASVTAARAKTISKNSWTPVRAAFVPTLTPAELQQIIWNKEAKVPSYWQQCWEVWLLIVARGFEPSTFGDLGPEIEAHEFETTFDRVFFLHYFDGSVSELHVRRVI
jgi:hypothetical protein